MQAFSIYPEAADAEPTSVVEADSPNLLRQLSLLGFTSVQARNAINFLSVPSALTSNLLDTLSPLDAAIEYLVLHVPECDLPDRFLPSTTSSDPFITAVHGVSDVDLKKRWIEDKAVKEAGWPAHIVKECASHPELLGSWESLITALDCKLIGEDWKDLFKVSDNPPKTYSIDPEEIEALGAHYFDSSKVIMPLFTAPVQLHILLATGNIPSPPPHPPMYLTSNKVPPYVRLHLLSRLLCAAKRDDFVEPGEGFCLAAMRLLEEEWASIEDNGPPDMSAVMQYLVPRSSPSNLSEKISEVTEQMNSSRWIPKHQGADKRRDPRSDSNIKADYEAVCRTDGYLKLLSVRKTLPAFTVKKGFLDLLERSRVVIVVGETGELPLSSFFFMGN